MTRRKQRTCQLNASAVKRQRLRNLRPKAQKARRTKNRISKSMRERRVVGVRAEQGHLPPMLRRYMVFELHFAQAPRRITNVASGKEEVNWFVTKHDGERVCFRAARYDNSGITGLERAQLLQRRAVDNLTIDIPLQIPP